MNILYLTYDGLMEPLGQSQVLAYQEKLAKDFKIVLMSFEKSEDLKDRTKLKLMQERVSKTSIKWIIRRYHKFPSILATAYDLFAGIIHCSYLVMRYRIQVIHARSYPPALIALFFKKFFGIKFIFDMRGFWADEKVDGGHWSRSSHVYAVTKYFERRFFESADAIVSLTHAGVDAFGSLGYDIADGTMVEVIPTCANLDRFRPGPKDARLMSELGLTGHWRRWHDQQLVPAAADA